MKPYYQEDGITIYYGDCREILPLLPAADALVTDPPYGISLNTDWSGLDSGRRGNGQGRVHLTVAGDHEPFDPSHLMGFRRQVIFGANHFASKLPDNGAWIVFNKRGFGDTSKIAFGDAELAWTNLKQVSVRMFSMVWHGSPRWRKEPVCHPNQKPVALMIWVIERYTEPDSSIVDAYMGAGATLIAAKELGRKAIGIEIEEKYCEIAAKRLAQGVMEFA